MNKSIRARLILSQVLGLDQTIGFTPENIGAYKFADIRVVEIPKRWRATIQRSANAIISDAKTWDLLTIQASGELKLSIRFFDDRDELILFRPGVWETWFSTYEPADLEEVLP